MSSRSANVSRNDPCPCGSGKKYKRCCKKADDAKASAAAAEEARPDDEPDDRDVLALALPESMDVAQSWYDVEDEAEARAFLEAVPEVRADADGGGYVLPDDFDRDAPLAWVRFGDGEVRVVATNGDHLMAARELLESWDEEGVLYHVRSSISDVRITLELLREEREAAGDEPEEIDRAVRDLLTTTLRSYYERWIHLPNEALDDRTPMAVTKTRNEPRREMLIGILTLLDQQEAAAPWADDLPYDFAEVWEMLGLDRDAAMPSE